MLNHFDKKKAEICARGAIGYRASLMLCCVQGQTIVYIIYVLAVGRKVHQTSVKHYGPCYDP